MRSLGRISCLFLALLIVTLPSLSSGGTTWIRDTDWLVDSAVQYPQLLTRHPRFLVFSNSGIIKLIFGLVIPIDLRKRSLVWVTNIQFQYSTPVNYTQLFPVTYSRRSGGDVRSVRAIDRSTIYEVIRMILERQGIDGRACLLRAICQVAETPIAHNGLVGELMNVLFTPDTSSKPHSRWRRGGHRWGVPEILKTEEILHAQHEGEAKRREGEASVRRPRSAAGAEGATYGADVCRDGFPSCPSSILDMISILLEV